MARKILVPGQPGDLVLILQTAHTTMQDALQDDDIDACSGIATTTLEALEMWLGLRPVADDPGEDTTT